MADLVDHGWCLLFAAKYALRTDDTRLWVDRAVDDIDSEDVRAMLVWVFMPHADNDVCPWVAAESK